MMRKLRKPKKVKRPTLGFWSLVSASAEFFLPLHTSINNTRKKIFSLTLLVKAGILLLESKFDVFIYNYFLSNDYYHTNLSIP